MDEFKEDFVLLFEGGLIAVKQGDEKSAVKIFQALELLDPEHFASSVGKGLIALHKMRLDEALEVFGPLAEKEGDNWSVKAFLSLTHMLIVLRQERTFDTRRDSLKHSFDLAQEILRECKVESTCNFAQSLIDWHSALAERSSGPLG